MYKPFGIKELTVRLLII